MSKGLHKNGRKNKQSFSMMDAIREGEKRMAREEARALEEEKERHEEETRRQELKDDREYVEKQTNSIKTQGSALVPKSYPRFYRVVGMLKSAFRGSDYRWSMTDVGFAIARKQRKDSNAGSREINIRSGAHYSSAKH